MGMNVKEVKKAITAMNKTLKNAKKRQQKAVGGQEQQQQQQQQEQIAGNVKVYTGPKQGKFIINKHGKKVYIDRKTLNNNVPYIKKKGKK